MTRLDEAHKRLSAAPEDADARAAYLGALADTEVFLRLQSEPDGDEIEPELIETSAGEFALAYDTAERLAEGAPVARPYAALPGRVIADLLASENIGLAMNVGAGTEMIVTAGELAWLTDQLAEEPEEAEARIVEARAPGGLPDKLLTALDAQLARAEGLAKAAHLAEVTYADGRKGHLLAVTEAAAGSEPAFARSIDNALRFSGLDAAALDVAFFSADDPAAARIARVGLGFDIPQPSVSAPIAPGTDPAKPPKLH